MSVLTHGNLFRVFQVEEYSEVVYRYLLLRTSWDWAACPRQHRLAGLIGGSVGNQTPNLWFCSQITTPLSYLQPNTHYLRTLHPLTHPPPPLLLTNSSCIH